MSSIHAELCQELRNLLLSSIQCHSTEVNAPDRTHRFRKSHLMQVTFTARHPCMLYRLSLLVDAISITPLVAGKETSKTRATNQVATAQANISERDRNTRGERETPRATPGRVQHTRQTVGKGHHFLLPCREHSSAPDRMTQCYRNPFPHSPTALLRQHAASPSKSTGASRASLRCLDARALRYARQPAHAADTEEESAAMATSAILSLVFPKLLSVCARARTS